MAKAAGKKPLTKSQVLASLSEATGLTKKEVGAVCEAMTGEIKKALSPRGPGVFVLPGLIKIEKKKVPPRPARKGINPATGEPVDIPAKPATVKVKVRALKGLKSMI
jgi:nucleoid DNA-binding protein